LYDLHGAACQQAAPHHKPQLSEIGIISRSAVVLSISPDWRPSNWTETSLRDLHNNLRSIINIQIFCVVISAEMGGFVY